MNIPFASSSVPSSPEHTTPGAGASAESRAFQSFFPWVQKLTANWLRGLECLKRPRDPSPSRFCRGTVLERGGGVACGFSGSLVGAL